MAGDEAAPRPEDMLRILIATDNHLGYADKQPEKEDDSFDTFEEILQIALKEDVDFVLLGGDLFHENKPNRQSELKAFQVWLRSGFSMSFLEGFLVENHTWFDDFFYLTLRFLAKKGNASK